MEKIKLKNLIYPTFTFAILAFSFVFTQDSEMLNQYVTIACLPIFVYGILNIGSLKDIIQSKNKVLLYWLLFAISLFLAELQNGNVMDSLFLISILPVLLIKKIDYKLILRSMAIGFLPITLASLLAIFVGNKFTSNTVGLMNGIELIIILILYVNDKKKTLMKNIGLLISIGIIGYILLEINSRTSQLIVVSALFILFIHSIVHNKDKIIALWKSPKTKWLVTLVTIVILVVVSFISYKILGNIFKPKWRPNDISTGRFDIWLKTIQHMKLFGYPYDWYYTSGLFGTFRGPHNIFVGILGFGGIITLIFYVVFLLYTSFLILKQYFKNPSNENIVIVMLFFVPMVKGLTESMIIQQFFNPYSILYILGIYLYIKSQFRIDYKPKYTVFNVKLVYAWILMILIGSVYGSVLLYDLSALINLISRYL